MSAQATYTAVAKININPQGITIMLEGIDKDLGDLLAQALNFAVSTPVYRTYDISDVTIQSTKVISFVEPEPEP